MRATGWQGKDDMEIVSTLTDSLVRRVGRERYDLWLSGDTSLLLDGGKLVVEAASRFKLDWLRNQFASVLKEVAREVLGDTPIEYRVNPTISAPEPQKAAPEAAAQKKSEEPAKPKRKGRRFSNFRQFVVSDANKVAMASAQMVVSQLGEVSPLLIYGPAGTGKTHLLEAIWSSARRKDARCRVVYLSAEQFTSYFLEGLRGSGLPNFRRKYRGVDLLIVDDLQFLIGKQATITELQHTIDTLQREGKQLVFASSRPPAELSDLGPELVTRLTGGLVCGLRRPDLKARREILRRLCTEHNFSLPPEVIELIANQLAGDARQLAGALHRLRATHSVTGEPITRGVAAEALGEMFLAASRAVELADIERAVCDVFGIAPQSLQSDRKTKSVSHPRMLAMWLARKHTPAALSEIGQYFGRRSHTTVISAQKKVGNWMSDGSPLKLLGRDWNVEDAIRQVETRLRTG